MAQNSSNCQVRPISQGNLVMNHLAVSSQSIPAPPLVPISSKSLLKPSVINNEVRIPIYFESAPTQSYASKSLLKNNIITSSAPAPKLRVVGKTEATSSAQVSQHQTKSTAKSGKSGKTCAKKNNSRNARNIEEVSDETEELTLRELVVLKTRKNEYVKFMKFAEDHLPKYKFLSKPRRREYRQALLTYLNDLHFARDLDAKRHRK